MNSNEENNSNGINEKSQDSFLGISKLKPKKINKKSLSGIQNLKPDSGSQESQQSQSSSSKKD